MNVLVIVEALLRVGREVAGFDIGRDARCVRLAGGLMPEQGRRGGRLQLDGALICV